MKKNILLILSLITAINAFSQYGMLDDNFGSGGILIINTDSSSEINSIAVQKDGKIILAGYAFNGSNYDFAVYRLFPDGSFDNSFGTNGKVLTDFSNDDKANSVQIQPDNKILVGGLAAYYTSGTTFALARYNSNGTLDNSFGLNGKILSGTGYGFDREVTLLLQTDGKIIIAGNNYDLTGNYSDMVRYTADGAVDHTFSFGKDTLRGYFDCAELQSNGNIMVGGWIKDVLSNYDGVVARFKSGGSADSTFSYDGKVPIDFSTGDNFTAIALQMDQKIIAAGSTLKGMIAFKSIIARINSNGLLDDSFGNHGKVTLDTSTLYDEGIYTLLVQPDNKIVAAGYTAEVAEANFKLYRFNENGTMDNTFGTNGIVIQNDPHYYGNCEAFSLALQPDGKILAAGHTTINNTKKMMVMRFTTGLPPVGIQKNEENSKFSVFPNPFINELNISAPDMKSQTILTISSLQGQNIYTSELITEKQSLDLDFLNAGLYILRIVNSTYDYSTLIVKSR
jgi:uncharacterized delta-60 repeat protein